MKCKYCVSFSKTCPPAKKVVFIEGCTSYKVESVTIHKGTDYHRRATKMEVAPGETVATKTLKSMQKEFDSKLFTMFRTVHYLGKCNHLISNFVEIFDLDHMKGHDMGATYRNRTSAKEFMAYTALAALKDVAYNIKTCKFISIMGDDSTDCATVEQSMWFTQTASQGKVKVQYIGLSSLEKADT